jgi:hypothetical protein
MFRSKDDPDVATAVGVFEPMHGGGVEPKGGACEPALLAGIERHATGIPSLSIAES